MPRTWLTGFAGTVSRLSDERRRHMLEHPEMAELQGAMAETLQHPHAVVQSRSDPSVRLYYRHYYRTAVGDRFLCVVVKFAATAFVITAYLTDRVKEGTPVWPSDT